MVVVVVFDTAVNVTTIGSMATIDDDDDLATVRPVCQAVDKITSLPVRE